MTTPPSTATLSRPLRTDTDILTRIEQLIDPIDRVRPGLWLFFLDQNQAQLPVVVPIEDIPDDPEPQLVGNLCWTVAQVMGYGLPADSLVIARTRPGPATPDETDRTWYIRLRDAAALHGAPVRMICLATPEGVLPLDD
jgi:hypothetical protein